MTELEILREENKTLHEVLAMIAKNLTNSDGIDPESWWLELTADEAALIRAVVEKNANPPPVEKEPELRCAHGILWGHCPDCPTLEDIASNECEQAAREKRHRGLSTVNISSPNT